MRCINLPRIAAKEWTVPVNPDKVIWISIGEPEKGFEHVQNKILNKIPTLKISFQDLKEDQIELDDFPPSLKLAGKIISFLLKNPKKRVIVNCAAGISRSGAICKFLQDYMGYKWSEYGKRYAVPNMYLYRLLEEAYKGRIAEINEHKGNRQSGRAGTDCKSEC